MMENWPNGEDWLRIPIDILKRALKYFGISEEEWVNYGDAVIEMYNLENDPDMKEFGYIDAIKPMKNNRHLL